MRGARVLSMVILGLGALAGGCRDVAEQARQGALPLAAALGSAARTDVGEVRSGLPKGAEALGRQLANLTEAERRDPGRLQEVILQAREKVQDLRVAKSTFFAFASREGEVLRSDQEQDRLVGQQLFPAFPALRSVGAGDGKYLETRGSLAAASGVADRPDGQWVAAAPVRLPAAASGSAAPDSAGPAGLFVTGWSWSAYARRLEEKARSDLRSALADGGKMPLVYAFVLVEGHAYGAPVTPEVSLRAIEALGLPAQLKDDVYSTKLVITGRDYGLAAVRIPELGKDVAVGILRSET